MQSIYDFFVFASSVEIELERPSGRRTYKRKVDVIELDSPCLPQTANTRAGGGGGRGGGGGGYYNIV